MFYKIEVKDKSGIFDAAGAGVKSDILDFGIKGVRDARFVQVYNIEGNLTEAEIKRICDELLTDKICQNYSINSTNDQRPTTNDHIVEVAYNPGVMDPVESSTLKGISDLGIEGAESVKTAKKYIIRGKLSAGQLKTICEKLLYNKLIQHIVKPSTNDQPCLSGRQGPTTNYQKSGYQFNLATVNLLNISDKGLIELSKKGQLFLNLAEMRAIKDYFKGLKRNPTDCELETIAQTWSEHCNHKTFRGKIRYTEKIEKKKVKLIDGLLKSTIMKVTKELNKPWCVSVFKDNAGIIRFDDKNNVCFKVETHNHPSALEPFGGANTGIGGVIRDPMGTGLGAKPFLNTDVFCFGLPDYPFSKLPVGSLHPKRVMKGVVSGVQDYGNKMGIPTVNGAILFHEKFTGNPLVYCGTAGIMPKDKSFKKTNTGDLVVVVGGRTGRDGIHGATFSSGELTHESETISSGAVQIGNPIQEKKMLDTILQARDKNLYSAITDCGAGGLSSACGEMGAELGVRVELDKVPLKYSGLSYMEIWISESQERMVLAVPPEKLDRLLQLFRQHGVDATAIGEFTDTGVLELFCDGKRVGELKTEFLHRGIPQIARPARWVSPPSKEPAAAAETDLTALLTKVLSGWDTCSKEWIIRRYDHEVQGGSVVKPLVGARQGPSDAAIVRPRLDSMRGIILSNGINFRYGDLDPYWMAALAVDEAVRQVIAVGGSLDHLAILDNFCWGDPTRPEVLGSLARAAFGCSDAAKAFGTPFISGKDSLHNEYRMGEKTIQIPGTLLISAIGVIPDVTKAVSMDAKQAGDFLYIVGLTKPELGGSAYYAAQGLSGGTVPRVDLKRGPQLMRVLSGLIQQGLAVAAHDCSEGGIGVAAAEMAFAGGCGLTLDLKNLPVESSGTVPKNDWVLFSESPTRFLVEVPADKAAVFEEGLKGFPVGRIGEFQRESVFRVLGVDGTTAVDSSIDALQKAWQHPFQGW